MYWLLLNTSNGLFTHVRQVVYLQAHKWQFSQHKYLNFIPLSLIPARAKIFDLIQTLFVNNKFRIGLISKKACPCHAIPKPHQTLFTVWLRQSSSVEDFLESRVQNLPFSAPFLLHEGNGLTWGIDKKLLLPLIGQTMHGHSTLSKTPNQCRTSLPGVTKLFNERNFITSWNLRR